MRIQAVTGVVLMTLLFMSALMESKLLDVTADQFFFDNHKSAGSNHMAVSDYENGTKIPERPLASLSAQNGNAMKTNLAEIKKVGEKKGCVTLNRK